MRFSIGLLAILFMAASPARAADPMMDAMTGAAKDAATQAATDKAKSALGVTPTTSAPAIPKAPSVQTIKEQEKQKATDSAVGAIPNILGK